MLSEVVCSWPFLVLFTTTRDGAFIVFPLGVTVRMAASYVPLNIVRSAETIGAGTSGDFTMVRLRVLLLVFPCRALARI